MGRVIIDGVVDPFAWGKVKVRWFFAHPIGDRLTCGVSKLMHTLLTDVEPAFLGFGNACASAGRDGCKLLTLLHEDATGEEVKRLIEDSHDVSGQPGVRFTFTHLGCGTQLALKILLTKPAEVVVDPRWMKGACFHYTLMSHNDSIGSVYSSDLLYVALPGGLEFHRERGPIPPYQQYPPVGEGSQHHNQRSRPSGRG